MISNLVKLFFYIISLLLFFLIIEIAKSCCFPIVKLVFSSLLIFNIRNCVNFFSFKESFFLAKALNGIVEV